MTTSVVGVFLRPLSSQTLSMHTGSLRALGFDRVVDVVRGLAGTPLGAARLARLRPMTDPRSVQAALAATTEGTRFLRHAHRFPLDAPADLEAILSALAIEGRPLEPLPLLRLAAFLLSLDEVRAAIEQAAGGPYPILQSIVESCSSFEREAADIRAKIDAAGTIVDEASPDLRAIRDRLRKQRARLRNTLESYLRGKDTARYLQEQIVTDRSGRYVLVVKAEYRASIPGIVHGSSASGASLFLEPLSTVEINNDIVALEEDERAEEQRILLALANAIRKRAYELHRTLSAATELDVIQAKAAFSQMVDGIEPELVTEPLVELRRARHPLLIRAVAARAVGSDDPTGRKAQPAPPEGPVPVDLLLTPPTTALIVTGPNTGGKTVALKTAGLLALMAQAGLHVPAAARSRLPVFRSVFADIGDEQSIAASLSTFSGHITNIAAMDEALTLPALVLLDEVGVGTDPIEGGALGCAIVEHFRQRGALVVTTTHDEMLKSYASTTPGVMCAALGFEPDTYAPTFDLKYGTAGRSLALEIASRLGLAPAIIETARRHRGAREAQLAAHLAQVDQRLRSLDEERRQVASERNRLEQAESTLHTREARIGEREDAVRQRLQSGADAQLRAAREEIDVVLSDLRRRVDDLTRDASARLAAREPVMSTGDVGALKTAARAAVESVAERLQGAAPATPPPELAAVTAPARATGPAVGDRVRIRGLGLEGVVRALQARDVEVDVSGKRLRVPVDDVTVAGPASTAGGGGGRVSVHLESDAAPTDLNVIGCTVDEAVSRAEKFLDQALLNELKTVRVIHGHGTGQLRRAVAELLGAHPFVARYQAAPPDQGGAGVTVVELKD